MAYMLLAYCMPVANSSAQTFNIRETLKAMPDSLTPYLTTNNRLDMIDFMDARMKAVVTNALDGETEMTFLSDDSLAIQMSKAMLLEMKLHKSGTTAIATIRQTYTIAGGRPEVTLRRFDTSTWSLLSTEALSSAGKPVP